MTQATPLPWSPFIGQDDDDSTASTHMEIWGGPSCGWYVGEIGEIGDADLICRAVNNFDDLLQICHDLIQHAVGVEYAYQEDKLNELKSLLKDEGPRLIQRAGNIIKKAEGRG